MLQYSRKPASNQGDDDLEDVSEDGDVNDVPDSTLQMKPLEFGQVHIKITNGKRKPYKDDVITQKLASISASTGSNINDDDNDEGVLTCVDLCLFVINGVVYVLALFE